jgi:putative FmdB family regulatory protein
MPVYDYKCKDHGLFHALATMDDSGLPQPCPKCGTLSGRVIMISPAMLGMDSLKRDSHARNEKAMHQPIMSSPEFRKEEQARHEHKHGAGCCAHKPVRKSMLFYTADGNKMFPSMRPWMISH